MTDQPFHQSRPFYAIVVVFILALFFFAGPFFASIHRESRTANADARMSRWLDAVTPQEAYQPISHAYDPPGEQTPEGGGPEISLYPLEQNEPTGGLRRKRNMYG